VTRTRNTAFRGITPPECDVDVKAYQRVVLESVQDFNRLYDVCTGENGVSSVDTILHNCDGGAGSPLGVPIINTYVGFKPWLEDASTANLYGGDLYIYGFTAFIPQGETAYELVLEFASDDVDLEVLDLTGASYYGGLVPGEYASTAGGTMRHRWLLQFQGTGERLIFLFRKTIETEGDIPIRHVRMYPARLAADVAPRLASSTGENPFPVPVPASGLPADAATGVEIIHDEMCVAQYALPGRVLTVLNRNLNAMWEYITGSPVPGNDEVTNADTSSTNPTTSRFMAHTQSEFASEPLVEWPLFAEGVGCSRVDNGAFCCDNVNPPTDGVLDWHVPYPRDVAATTGHQIRLRLPDFPTASSQLKILALFVNESGKGTPGNWEARVTTGAGSSAWVFVTQVGSTNLWTAELTAVPFTADINNNIALETRNLASAFVFGELAFKGWSGFFTAL
jgi:hypothetical protein